MQGGPCWELGQLPPMEPGTICSSCLSPEASVGVGGRVLPAGPARFPEGKPILTQPSFGVGSFGRRSETEMVWEEGSGLLTKERGELSPSGLWACPPLTARSSCPPPLPSPSSMLTQWRAGRGPGGWAGAEGRAGLGLCLQCLESGRKPVDTPTCLQP